MQCNAPDSLQQQIAALLHTEEQAITLKFQKLPSQTNTSDCGVYDIAYARALSLGRSPAKVLFDEHLMQPHLIKCLEDGQFAMFPGRQTGRKVTIKAEQCIWVYCHCRMPSIDGCAMIECTGCAEWFHIDCVSPTTSVLNCTNMTWYCKDCS